MMTNITSFFILLLITHYMSLEARITTETLLHSDNLLTINPTEYEIYKIFFPLKITDETFYGFKDLSTGREIPGLNPKQMDSFKTLRYMVSNLTITANHPEFKNLSFFNNLKTIYHLVITNTSLFYLDLSSLQEITTGVVIEHNKNLCVNRTQAFWQNIVHDIQSVIRISDNKPESECAAACDEQCDQELGCWGPRRDQCRKCRHLQEQSTKLCVDSCDNETQHEAEGECSDCHPECEGGCTGSYGSECHSCKHVRRRDDCISKCDHDEYVRDGKCLSCHEDCKPSGCSGPSNEVGHGGCNGTCPKLVILSLNEGLDYYTCGPNQGCFTEKMCLKSDDTCPDGYFQVEIPHDAAGEYMKLAGKQVCTSCHPYCLKCTDHGFNNKVCQECSGSYQNCTCPPGSYYDKSSKLCPSCSQGFYDRSCKECSEEGGCLSCVDWHYRVYDRGVPSENASFKCMLDCPPHQPYTFYDDVYQKYCSSQNNTLLESNNIRYELVSIYLALIVVVCLIAIVIYILMRKRANLYKTQIKINQFYKESDESVETTNIASSTTKLRIIKESDIKKVKVLASGDFSTVCQGVLSLEDGKTKVPVAINILNTVNKSTLTTELLKEARAISCVNHPQLLRLLAICISTKLTLVTQFMEMGDLLLYLQKYKSEIKQKTLVNWCFQIAKGMDCLEQHGIVHRNLAARKVLILTPNKIKVSFFGAERALDKGREIYAALGEKPPTKWMSLESLKQGIFSHKSDVWSFGVTVWEILTYGEEPYGETSVHELLTCLEMGERLQQPETCPVDMYSVLATCWVEETHARPSFHELVDIFSKMAADPAQFATITQVEENQTVSDILPSNYYCEIDGELANSHSYININKTGSEDSLTFRQEC